MGAGSSRSARPRSSRPARDRRTLGVVIGTPLLMVLAFGYTFGGEVHEVRPLVVNEDTGSFADLLLENITGDALTLVPWSSEEGAREEVQAGRAWAALVFPANFSEELLARRASIRAMLDGSSPTIVAAVLGTLRAAAERAFAGAGGAAALSPQPDFVYGSEDTRFIDSFAPGVVVLAVLMVTTVFSVIIIVREKAGGMLERLFATPLRPSELVVGHALALALVAFAQSVVVLGAALLIFQVQIVGSLPLAFGVLLLFAVGNQGLGMMLSAAARNEVQAVQFIPLRLFPSLLLPGGFFPLEALPAG